MRDDASRSTPPRLLPEQQRFMAAQFLMATQTAPRRPSSAMLSAPKATANVKDVGQKRKQAAPRKPAPVVRKETREDLAEQVRVLEARIDRRRRRMGLPTKADKQALVDAKAFNEQLEDRVYANMRLDMQLQSMARAELQKPPVNPLSTYIHLPSDQAQRREILEGMKHVKLRRAAEIGIERFRYLDAHESYMSEERFMGHDGVYHTNRWEMSVFPQFKSAKQMYEAMLFWIYNMEISVTERLNQVVVREDDDSLYDENEPTIWNHRMVSTEEIVGCTEVNLVGFAQFYQQYDLLDGGPLGIIICDTVDEDDLYPYKPEERTHKDAQSILMFHEVVDVQTQRKDVVFKAVNMIGQLPPQFPMAPEAIEKLRRDASRWPKLLCNFLGTFNVAPGNGT